MAVGQNRSPKWNPDKWKHGLKPEVPWWFKFDGRIISPVPTQGHCLDKPLPPTQKHKNKQASAKATKKGPLTTPSQQPKHTNKKANKRNRDQKTQTKRAQTRHAPAWCKSSVYLPAATSSSQPSPHKQMAFFRVRSLGRIYTGRIEVRILKYGCVSKWGRPPQWWWFDWFPLKHPKKSTLEKNRHTHSIYTPIAL